METGEFIHRVATARIRKVAIAPSICECGDVLQWWPVETNTGRRWEYAFCEKCPILWHKGF